MVSAVAPALPFFSLLLSLFHHFIITISASLDFRLACLVLRVFQGGRGPTILLYSKKYLLDILCYAKSTFSNGRIHFRNAWRYFLGEVIEEESADVEESLWHVGTERLILKKQTVKNERWKVKGL